MTHRFDDTTETKGFYQGVTRDTVCLSEKKKKTFITTAINNMSRMYSGVSYVRQQNRNKPQTTCREQQNRRVVISTEPFDSLPSQQVKNKRLLLQEVEAQRVTGSEQSSEIARHPRINRWRRTRKSLTEPAHQQVTPAPEHTCSWCSSSEVSSRLTCTGEPCLHTPPH